MGLFISYWRCNYTRKVRIMRHEENATPSTIAEIPLKGESLTDADVLTAEALIEQMAELSINGEKSDALIGANS